MRNFMKKIKNAVIVIPQTKYFKPIMFLAVAAVFMFMTSYMPRMEGTIRNNQSTDIALPGQSLMNKFWWTQINPGTYHPLFTFMKSGLYSVDMKYFMLTNSKLPPNCVMDVSFVVQRNNRTIHYEQVPMNFPMSGQIFKNPLKYFEEGTTIEIQYNQPTCCNPIIFLGTDSKITMF